MSTSVEDYMLNGCGRCSLGGTADCKVHRWTSELELLRMLVLDSGLKEASKWGVPCYTLNGKNVLIVSAFNNFCSINFFKGSLLNDPKQLLEKPGKNTQAGRLLKFTDLEGIQAVAADIHAYISEAIEIEKAGVQVATNKSPEPIPKELENRLADDPTLKAAFETLTPGRQRGYILHISGSKQAKTREARLEKYIPKILNGEGMHDAYRRNKKG